MLFELFKTFFMIGAFTFGGGTAMISIMEKEIVQKKAWLNIDEFLDLISLAQASPGPMAVNCSIIIGYKLKGLAGALVSVVATTLPSFLIMIAIATVFTKAREFEIVNDAFMGIRPVVAALMASSVVSMASQSKFKIPHYLVLIGVAFLISFAGVSPIIILLVGGIGYLIYKIL